MRFTHIASSAAARSCEHIAVYQAQSSPDSLLSVAPHVGVPCGHSYCGECCVRWMKQNPGRHPSCPTCRVKLARDILVVPNYSLQHTIDKHVAALGATGVVDWQPTGTLYQERQQRQT
ncbi:hypothetical protein BD311DRAFT_649194 [Dichomitus squalens]|uniref:RING-type domain-containing protein n=2 Tax=Dichomitus squalens TaxID=114155 RepID=A0A4Q9QC99_9APHY|nr:hypothetical protein BD311DRAFT_649194 [Dichomitus squalens]TBU64796.1 hypothetical protein BD310DRAFT_805484 [Dichomitus squalens]